MNLLQDRNKESSSHRFRGANELVSICKLCKYIVGKTSYSFDLTPFFTFYLELVWCLGRRKLNFKFLKLRKPNYQNTNKPRDLLNIFFKLTTHHFFFTKRRHFKDQFICWSTKWHNSTWQNPFGELLLLCAAGFISRSGRTRVTWQPWWPGAGDIQSESGKLFGSIPLTFFFLGNLEHVVDFFGKLQSWLDVQVPFWDPDVARCQIRDVICSISVIECWKGMHLDTIRCLMLRQMDTLKEKACDGIVVGFRVMYVYPSIHLYPLNLCLLLRLSAFEKNKHLSNGWSWHSNLQLQNLRLARRGSDPSTTWAWFREQGHQKIPETGKVHVIPGLFV